MVCLVRDGSGRVGTLSSKYVNSRPAVSQEMKQDERQ